MRHLALLPRVGLCSVVVLNAMSPIALAAEASLPAVRVDSVRRAFYNGEHNAFTDLCRFKGRYYLTFRSCPDGHMVHPTSRIIVLAGDDGRTWEPVFEFRVPQRDVRDPHFLEFQGRLFVYSGTWYCGDTSPKARDLNEHLGYAAVLEPDAGGGKPKWRGPILLEGTYGHYIWRAAAHGDRAYLCARRKKDFQRSDEPEPEVVESAIIESDDGLIWRKAGLFQPRRGDETAFVFETDGSILAVARGGGRTDAELCRLKTPHSESSIVGLGRQIGGPLLTRWGNRLLVGGRKSIGEPRTALYWLSGDALHEIAELPSGGDCSYPGFVPLDNHHGLVSWYSTHERAEGGQPITAIYLADLSIDE